MNRRGAALRFASAARQLRPQLGKRGVGVYARQRLSTTNAAGTD